MEKKIKITINVMMGIKFSTLFRMVLKNGLGLHPIYILRFIILIPGSFISQILVWVEKIKFGKKIKETSIDKPPLFIIGHWRSGTTLLHQLIFLDNQFTSPTLVQTIIPEHFLFSTKYYVPVMVKMMPQKRPMDEIKMRPYDPMEDEFGLVKMGSVSPFIKILFPSSKSKFLSDINEFVPEDKELVRWQRNFLILLKKITFLTQKQIVLKNPFHTPRMSILSEMFPGARFIHIVRHPYKIIPSTINMWDIVAQENSLKSGWKKPTIEDSAEVLEKFWQSVDINKHKLGKNVFSEIKYEDLEIDPVKELKRIYRELNIGFNNDFECRILEYMEKEKNYKKNVFVLSSEENKTIYKKLDKYFQKYNYNA
jgi:omega-hydroxy-beta-dihydromenaquinone-9 sulfotransferase